VKRIRIVFFILALTTALSAQTRQEPASIALIHVTVIDATGSAPKADMTVILSGDRISEIGKSGKVRIPNNARVIDARGKFLIPGLWDMHVHAWNKEALTLLVANGVTGVREMFGSLQSIQAWRKETQEGALILPRMVAAGPIVDGPKPFWPGSIAVSNEAEGRQAVTKVKSDGSDFVKVYSMLPREAYFAIADEAKKQGIPFAGHVPSQVRASEASDAGQKSIEHLTGILHACSSKEDELLKEITDVMRKPDASTIDYLRRVGAQNKTLLETYSEEKARALFARFVKNGTYQSPTLTVLRMIASIGDPEFTSDARMKYISPSVKSYWQNSLFARPRSPQSLALDKRLFQKYLDVVGAMRKAGVEILAGTDLGNPYIFPGFSLHDELALLVKAGLTPMEALQSATRNPARFLGTLNSTGTVEKGKTADLVLLDADPLADIANTQRIDSVIVGGRLIVKSELQKMRDEVEAAASRK